MKRKEIKKGHLIGRHHSVVQSQIEIAIFERLEVRTHEIMMWDEERGREGGGKERASFSLKIYKWKLFSR